mgnify:CR=1 FL=1
MPAYVEAEPPGRKLSGAEPAIGRKVGVLPDVDHRTSDVDDKRADRAGVLGRGLGHREVQEQDGHAERQRSTEARPPGKTHSWEYTGAALSPTAILRPYMHTVVSVSAIEDAARRIAGVARRTPLVRLPVDGAGTTVLAKCENLQAAGAFKIRGAYNFIARLNAEERGQGVITYSSGNHAQAVALAAGLVGARAVVVMPTTAPAIKVDGARSLGAEVVFEGTTSAERKQRAETLAAAQGLRMVPPFDHPWIIEGQGTVGLEILEDCPDAARVLVPVGGGGLLAGIAAAIKQQRPDVRVIGVEPTGAPKMHASLAAGHPITLARVASIADGLLPVRPGDLTFDHARQLVDDIVTVSDDAIATAVLWLFRRAKLVVETSGAASVAAAFSHPSLRAGGPTVVVLSGGNIAVEALAALAVRLNEAEPPTVPQ